MLSKGDWFLGKDKTLPVAQKGIKAQERQGTISTGNGKSEGHEDKAKRLTLSMQPLPVISAPQAVSAILIDHVRGSDVAHELANSLPVPVYAISGDTVQSKNGMKVGI